MPRSLFDSTMSMLDSKARKNGQALYMRCSSASPSGCSFSQASTAEPKPYQPGSIRRHCDHENTQGMARRSSILVDLVREDGREPIFSVAISASGVDWRK